MSKVLEVSEDIHKRISVFQIKMLEKYDKKPTMFEITELSLNVGIDKALEIIEERLSHSKDIK